MHRDGRKERLTGMEARKGMRRNQNNNFSILISVKFFLFALFFGALLPLKAAPLKIVAAENCYGEVAQQIAGPTAEVLSIMSNPNQDPHEFQSDAATARAVAQADIIIENGIGYDSWMEKLLGIPGKKSRLVIIIAELMHARKGDNPHLWYNPSTMPALAKKLAEVLNKPEAEAVFLESMKPLYEKIASLRTKTNGVKVTATEPVFNYMATALGLEILNEGYQQAIMNETEPTFQQTVAMEKSLLTKTARLLFNNIQASNASTTRLLTIAKKQDVPIIAVTETQPLTEKNYVTWMLSELEKIDRAL
ncbi:MAG: zinc ABC transporter substrate-binding protein [Chthoniobacterales bacterium]|nr:zinc ABC transporter substrate-binding protein [Chthoniobacterales bacterium]